MEKNLTDTRPVEEFCDLFTSVCRRAAAELFAGALGSSPTGVSARVFQPEWVGVIGFVGEGFHGTFSVSISGTEAHGASSDAEDWGSELANQLSGRVKSLLLREGFQYDIAPPVVLRGLQRSILHSPSGDQRVYSTDRCVASVTLEVEGPIHGGPGEQDAPSEGDLLLF